MVNKKQTEKERELEFAERGRRERVKLDFVVEVAVSGNPASLRIHFSQKDIAIIQKRFASRHLEGRLRFTMRMRHDDFIIISLDDAGYALSGDRVNFSTLSQSNCRAVRDLPKTTALMSWNSDGTWILRVSFGVLEYVPYGNFGQRARDSNGRSTPKSTEVTTETNADPMQAAFIFDNKEQDTRAELKTLEEILLNPDDEIAAIIGKARAHKKRMFPIYMNANDSMHGMQTNALTRQVLDSYCKAVGDNMNTLPRFWSYANMRIDIDANGAILAIVDFFVDTTGNDHYLSVGKPLVISNFPRDVFNQINATIAKAEMRYATGCLDDIKSVLNKRNLEFLKTKIFGE